MEVDQSAWNEMLKFRIQWHYAQIQFLDKDKNVLYTSPIPGITSGILDVETLILENTKYIKLYCSSSGGDGACLTEIQIVQEPQIALIDYLPKLTNIGVEQPYSMANINYSKSTKQKLYSLDNKNWLEYVGEVKVEVGQTIYAKGINEKGEESNVSNKTALMRKDAMGEGAYDGDWSKGITVWYDDTAWMEVDNNVWNLTLRFKLGWMRASIQFLDKDKKILYTSPNPGVSNGVLDIQALIPENTKYIKLYRSNTDGDGAYLYELEIKK